MRRNDIIAAIATIIILIVGLPIGIQLGKWGHPQSKWLYCDVLKWCG